MDRAYSPLSISLANPFGFSFHQLALYSRNLALAAGITVLLVFAMSRLIATDYVAPPDDPLPKVQEVVLPELKRTEEIVEPPVRPVDPPPQPVVPPVETRVTEVDPTITIAPPAPTDDGGPTISVSRDPLPFFKPAPNYPRAALRRGIEGYVVVEFTITKNGSVRDVRAVAGYDSAGNPTDIFNRSAVAAAARFKYQPQLDGGVPVERYGVRNRIRYKMAD